MIKSLRDWFWKQILKIIPCFRWPQNYDIQSFRCNFPTRSKGWRPKKKSGNSKTRSTRSVTAFKWDQDKTGWRQQTVEKRQNTLTRGGRNVEFHYYDWSFFHNVENGFWVDHNYDITTSKMVFSWSLHRKEWKEHRKDQFCLIFKFWLPMAYVPMAFWKIFYFLKLSYLI